LLLNIIKLTRTPESVTQAGIAGLLVDGMGVVPLPLSLSKELVDDDLESPSRLSFDP
jgi:hypothetical protein